MLTRDLFAVANLLVTTAIRHTEATVIILRDQLPWQRFALSSVFSSVCFFQNLTFSFFSLMLTGTDVVWCKYPLSQTKTGHPTLSHNFTKR